MEKFLLEKLGKISPEEEGLLRGEPLDPTRYGRPRDFTVTSSRLIQKGEIAIRTHTRYAPFPSHRHTFIEMMIVLSGELTHEIDGETVTLREGDMLFMNKHVTHAVRRAGTNDIGINLCLSDAFCERLLPELCATVFQELFTENGKPDGRGIYLHFSSGGKKQIENLIENMLYELTEYERADERILTKTLSLLTNYLSLKSAVLLLGGNDVNDRKEERRREILSYVENTYRDGTLTDLAEKLSLSPAYLSSLIFRLFGKTYKELLGEERRRQAMRLLLESDLSVGEIIRNIGYENESYFHRAFKRAVGVSPLAYRKRARGEK